MKKVYVLLAALCVATIAFAQVPKQMNYQGVARDANNQPLPNRDITLKLSILENIASTVPLYSEVFLPTVAKTNAMGLFTVKIGTGTSKTGNFDAINWGAGERFLKTEIDINGGLNYVTAGVPIQFVAVPYALVADTVLRAPRASITGVTAGGDLTGTYPDPRVKILNRPLGTTAPTAIGQVLGFDGTQWIATTPTTGGATYTAGTGISIQNNTISANIPTALPPNGTASGDLSGTYPSPTVAKLQGKNVSATAPTDGQVLQYSSANSAWQPTTAVGSSNKWSTATNQIYSLTSVGIGRQNSVPTQFPLEVYGRTRIMGGDLTIVNDGFGTNGVYVYNNFSSTRLLSLVQDNTSNNNGQVIVTNKGTGRTVEFSQQNSSSSGDLMYLHNEGTGRYINCLNGAFLSNGGSWSNACDKNLKENIALYTGVSILEKIASLPIYKWNYKKEPNIWHISPMSQDFYQTFQVGNDDKSISTIDPSGVALAGVKELHEKVKTQSTEIEQLKAQNTDLLKRLIELEKKINR